MLHRPSHSGSIAIKPILSAKTRRRAPFTMARHPG
jgi:hypothetical protein